MSWQLRVWNPKGDLLRHTYTNDAHRIIGGVEIQYAPSGDMLAMSFRGRNDLLNIYPMSLLEYSEDGQVLFVGVVTSCPPIDAPGAGPEDAEPDDLEAFECAGLKELLRWHLVGPKLWEAAGSYFPDNPLSNVLGYLAQTYVLDQYPELSVLQDITADWGPLDSSVLQVAPVYLPEMTVADAFDLILADAGAYEWGFGGWQLFVKDA